MNFFGRLFFSLAGIALFETGRRVYQYGSGSNPAKKDQTEPETETDEPEEPQEKAPNGAQESPEEAPGGAENDDLTDKHGRTFDPELHMTHQNGDPMITAKGNLHCKPGKSNPDAGGDSK